MHPDNKSLSDLEIAAYMEGRLSSEKKESFERRLSEDRQCMDMLVAINRVITRKDSLPIGDVPQHLIEKAIEMYPERRGIFDIIVDLGRDIIDVLYAPSDINVFTPLPAPDLRNAGISYPKMVVLTKSFDGINVEFNIEKTAGNCCDIKIAAIDGGSKVLINNLRVELISEGKELVSGLLKNGGMIFEDIKPGRYTIKIYKNRKIHGELTIKII
ncbi:MAG: hypothetical protein HZA10_08695 [Nitrospirae bacterium]|nr:hypothetical protein [Nitrospirota bacterium]